MDIINRFAVGNGFLREFLGQLHTSFVMPPCARVLWHSINLTSRRLSAWYERTSIAGACRIRFVQRIVPHVCIEIELIVIPNRIGLQEPPEVGEYNRAL